MIRDRIKELRRVRAGDLKPNPRNWRTHPLGQIDALRDVLTEIGYADALLARETPDGSLELIDGHARQSLDPDQTVPVLVLDLDDAEARKLITVLDPLAGMAETNAAALKSLLAEIHTEDAALQKLIDELRIPEDSVQIRHIDVQPPPVMTWVLIGIPLVRYGEIAAMIEAIAATKGVFIETTQNDG